MKRSRIKWLGVGGILLAALVSWQLYVFAVYDDCLDRIDYDKARKHLCDADPTKIYSRTPE